METFGNKFGAKKSKFYLLDFYCEKCDFNCFKKNDWNRHISTLKHNKLTLANEFYTQKQYECQFCNKKYYKQAHTQNIFY